MSRLGNFYRQLRKRRVIRTAVVYVALSWGGLQVADLLSDAGFLTENLVRMLIIATLAGFPLILISSWFFEAPWRRRTGLSVAGDVGVILAVAIGAGLLAWQQYFVSFARPTLAITAIEATDTRLDSEAFGTYLAGRLRMALAMRPELTVVELTSSLRSEVSDLDPKGRARALAADFMLTGTLNQSSDQLRVNLQLYDDSGRLVWSDGFDDHLASLGDMEGRIIEAVWTRLPLPNDGTASARSFVDGCDYPPTAEAVRYLVGVERGVDRTELAIDKLSRLIDASESNGLLYRARARVYFARRDEAAPPRQPVFNSLGTQDLQQLSDRCPSYKEAALLKMRYPRFAQADSDELETYLKDFPNDAALLLAFAEAWRREGDRLKSTAAAREACRIDPLNPSTVCRAVDLLREAGDGTGGKILSHTAKFLPQFEASCR